MDNLFLLSKLQKPISILLLAANFEMEAIYLLLMQTLKPHRFTPPANFEMDNGTPP